MCHESGNAFLNALKSRAKHEIRKNKTNTKDHALVGIVAIKAGYCFRQVTYFGVRNGSNSFTL